MHVKIENALRHSIKLVKSENKNKKMLKSWGLPSDTIFLFVFLVLVSDSELFFSEVLVNRSTFFSPESLEHDIKKISSRDENITLNNNLFLQIHIFKFLFELI